MQKIRWIHFSDLHLGNDIAVDTCLMRKKLPQYIAGLNQTFNYEFCTGDVKEWNKDYFNAADYLGTLCTASKTPLDHLFIVPGNHDVDIGGDDRAEVINLFTLGMKEKDGKNILCLFITVLYHFWAVIALCGVALKKRAFYGRMKSQ